ncbi:MAG: methyltransferase family protein [Parcubacteria group bacterium Gr01-1014_70]|nr:MAG: methyltransferase family protein [Parcubacteria group bacterium Gr01-1014_70]
MYMRIFSALSLPLRGQILGISGLKYFHGSPHFTPPQAIFADDAIITEADYPDVSILSLPYADNSFDVVIADQILEHVEGDPQEAVDEIHRVLKPGGIAIITSVFMYPAHWGPKDMWRFSPDGLRYLCRNFSEIIQCEGWGNRWYHTLGMFHKKIRDWKVPDRRLSIIYWLANKNENDWPAAVWIVVKK